MKTQYLKLLFLFLFACSPKPAEKEEIGQKTIDSLRQHIYQQDSIIKQESTYLNIWMGKAKKYKKLATSAYYQVLFQNPELESFRNKLYSDSINGKREVVEYILNEYPIINYFISTKPHLSIGTGYHKGLKSLLSPYKHETNYIRYTWWNTYIEEDKNFLFTRQPLIHYLPSATDPYEHIEQQKNFSTRSGINELAYALLIQEFKVNMKRDSESIKKYYQLYKKDVFELVDKELYEGVYINVTVSRLLAAYPYYKKKNPDGWEEYIQIEWYGDYQPEDKMRWKGRSRRSWYYGFWYRRDLEGNIEVVKEILEEIKEH